MMAIMVTIALSKNNNNMSATWINTVLGLSDNNENRNEKHIKNMNDVDKVLESTVTTQ